MLQHGWTLRRQVHPTGKTYGKWKKPVIKKGHTLSHSIYTNCPGWENLEVESRFVVARNWGNRKWWPKGARFLLGWRKCHKVDSDDGWTTLTLRSHWIIYFKCMNYTVCELHLNDTCLKKKRKAHSTQWSTYRQVPKLDAPVMASVCVWGSLGGQISLGSQPVLHGTKRNAGKTQGFSPHLLASPWAGAGRESVLWDKPDYPPGL